MLTPPIVQRSIVLLALACAVGSAQAQGAAGNKAPEGPTKSCSAANRQAVVELAQALEAANKRNRLNPVMMSRLAAFDSPLATLKGVTLRDSRSARDCEQVEQAIEAEHEKLQRLVGPDPQVSECMAANQQLHGQAVQALAELPEATRSQSPAQALNTRLSDLKPALAREGQTLTECRQTGAAVSQEQAQVLALAATAPRPTRDSAAINACRASNIVAYDEALKGWAGWASILGVTAGAAQYDAAMLRLRRLRDEMARPAGSLADCEALTRAIAQERALAPRGQSTPASATAAAAPARMPEAAPPPAALPTAAPAASPPPAPAAAPVAAAPTAAAANASCLVVHGDTYNALVQQFTRQLRVGDTSDAARLRLQGLSERLAAVHVVLASDAPGTDCKAVGQVLAGIAADLK